MYMIPRFKCVFAIFPKADIQTSHVFESVIARSLCHLQVSVIDDTDRFLGECSALLCSASQAFYVTFCACLFCNGPVDSHQAACYC